MTALVTGVSGAGPCNDRSDDRHENHERKQ